jgi:catechol 2,3-dioxygenase-like lactoylglutathione lyase family enzyme
VVKLSEGSLMSIIVVEDISHVRFCVPDLAQMRIFLEDFGLSVAEDGGCLFARGAGQGPVCHITEKGDAAFTTLGLRASSIADIEKLAAAEGAQLCSFDAPGGGQMVRLVDPNGNVVEVVAGQELRPLANNSTAPSFNSGYEHPRLGRAPLVSPSPAEVLRLGHVVLEVADFRESEAWYKERFGFLTSDEIEFMPGAAIGAFMRCDRGDLPADHHTLFLMQAQGEPKFNHAAFEVAGLNAVMTGHDHLTAKGYEAWWGVGRHILGNQIFDYWRDPWGHTLEHWTDGDLLTAADPPAKASVMDLLGVQWGPPMQMPGQGA